MTHDIKPASMCWQICIFLPSALLKFLTVLYSTPVEEFMSAEELKRYAGWLGGISPPINNIILWAIGGVIFGYSSTQSKRKLMLGIYGGWGWKVLPAVAKHLVMTSLLAHECEYGQNFSCGIIQHHTIQYITLHCITLHYTTLHYNTLHYTTLHCIALPCIALHCMPLHCIASHGIHT